MNNHMEKALITLTEKGVQTYWEERAARDGVKATGHFGYSLSRQDERYRIRKKFIFAHCPRNLRTLDYGCGIGRYAEEFEYYLGVDFTGSLLAIARERCPKARFLKLNSSFLDCELGFGPELIFTSCVLQHNPDDVVLKIFESFANIINHDIIFGLYENIYVQSDHMRGRTPKEYVELVGSYFKVQKWNGYIHDGDNHKIEEKYAFTLIKAIGN